MGEIEILEKSLGKYVVADKVVCLFTSGYSSFVLEILRTIFLKPTTVDSSSDHSSQIFSLHRIHFEVSEIGQNLYVRWFLLPVRTLLVIFHFADKSIFQHECFSSSFEDMDRGGLIDFPLFYLFRWLYQ